MVRRALALLAFAAPMAAFSASQGCDTEPLPQNVCNWLADSNNCYARFSDDVGDQCGDPFVEGNEPVNSATGFFAARDDLSICIKNAGGQVIFDPPLDVAALNTAPLGFSMLDQKAVECGTGSFTSERSYAITINAVDANDAGASAPIDDHITGGTFTAEAPADRAVLNITCAGGQETHNFNFFEVDKCREFEDFVPRAVYDFSPGIPESAGQVAVPGYVRFRVEYPPADPAASGAAPRTVEYFNCLIPAPPPPCQDTVRNNDETDIDCGGSCPAKCTEGQGCNINEDCQSANCGLNGGFQQCLP
jgi:hypothetical protein